ncbi:MAG: zinc ribbon domain-containing protein [Leptospiraceae bacterium]|nr:zinc ribbon domain-containing protein [Leptospiraceae bacterium]
MPTYDYKCADCGRIFEKFHGMNETPQVSCPECQSINTARQISLGAGIVFKGSGFYVNDYKKGGSGGTATAEKTTTKTESSSSSTATSGEAASTPAKSAHSCGPGCAHGS